MRKTRKKYRIICETKTVVRDGRTFVVNVIDNAHSDAVAARFPNEIKSRPSRNKPTSDKPRGLRTDSRVKGDDREDGRIQSV